MSKSKNDIAWEKLFKEHKIVEKISASGHAKISASEINKEREARLMTKFDHRSQLPEIFIRNGLSILPVSRGSYVIGDFDTFFDFDSEEIETVKIEFPTFLESLDYKDITSEATAINCAFVTNMLRNFLDEENLFPTVSGRMSSSSFDFKINSKRGPFKVNVDNSQIEIDGGYEGDRSLTLIEAKNYISGDFLVRQLYYPYKLWSNKINKQVRPVFLTYTNGIFHLREYVFDDIDHYNSLRLIRQKKYAVQECTINIESIQRILDTVEVVGEPDVPFPQADSFERVINLCELLKQRGVLTKEEITQNYDFDSRQTDYYSNAGKYLGLLNSKSDNGQRICYLTPKGNQVFNLSIVDRQIEFVKLILSHITFKQTLKLYFDSGNVPTRESIIEIMKQYRPYNVVSDSTYYRRASTITSWINWILNQIEE